jgi:hypothetical protein
MLCVGRAFASLRLLVSVSLSLSHCRTSEGVSFGNVQSVDTACTHTFFSLAREDCPQLRSFLHSTRFLGSLGIGVGLYRVEEVCASSG